MLTSVQELERIKRIADQMCTMHAQLRDRRRFQARLLELSTLGASLLVIGMGPLATLPQSVIGAELREPILALSGVIIFFFSLVIALVDFRGKAEAHERSLKAYHEPLRLARRALSNSESHDEELLNETRRRFDVAGEIGIEVPERHFLRLKAKHLNKVAISKAIDTDHPMPLTLIKLKLFWRALRGHGSSRRKS